MYKGEYGYANTRLEDTYILYEGSPVHVIMVRQDGMVSARFLNQRQDRVDVIEDHLDKFHFKCIPLGYINTQRSAEYLARIPRRRDWRQGLRANNTALIHNNEVVRINTEHFIRLFKRYKTQFPTLKQALAKRLEAGNKKAFSRDWATDGEHLFYRGNSGCGHVSDDKLVLSNQFKHLKESLERSVDNESYRVVYGA